MAVEDLIAPSVDLHLLGQLGLALALGLLVGLERERHHEDRIVLAGIRTYPMAAVTGTIFAHLAVFLQYPAFLAVGAAIAAAIALMLYYVRHTLQQHGLTSPMAFFTVFLAGVLIGLGMLLEGIVIGVSVTVLLFLRHTLHRFAEVMTEQELGGALQFLMLGFILFPLLSDAAVDPLGIIRPKQVLLIVLFVSGISFVSFLAIRIIGTGKGLAVSGLLGGLINSETVTGSLAALAHKKGSLRPGAAAGITLANATMLVRNLLVAAFVDPSLRLVTLLFPAILTMAALQAAWVFLWNREPLSGGKASPEEVLHVGNPFALKPALRFAVVFLLIQVATVALQHIPGTGDTAVLLTAVGGLVSSAAVVASAGAAVAAGTIDVTVAAATSMLAMLLSTLNKLFLTYTVDRPLVRTLRSRVLIPSAAGIVIILSTIYFVA